MTDVESSTPSKKYTCATCGKEFTEQRALAGHSLSHKADVECPYCGRTVGIAGLGSHIRSCAKNPDRNPHRKTKCPECKKSMYRASVTQHLAHACPVVKWKQANGVEVTDYGSSYAAEKASGTVVPPPDFPAPEPVAAPSTPVAPAITTDDDELLVVLDMLLPNGFKAQHFPLVQNWMEATRTLINQISQ